MDSIENETIAHLARLLNEYLNYILLRGAALALEGSIRKTSDIGILVSAEVVSSVVGSASRDCFVVKDGAHYLVTDSAHLPIDIPTKSSGEMSYGDLIPHVFNGTPTVSLPVALGVKIKTWYSRQDTEKGRKK